MEDHSISQYQPWHMNYLEELSTVIPLETAFEEESFNLKPSPNTCYGALDHRTPQHPLVISSSPNVLSFSNSSYTNQVAHVVKPKEEAVSSKVSATFPSDSLVSQGLFGDQNYVFKASHGAKRINSNTSRRPHSQTQDHIIAERKRREKLSQRFIALSAIVPGLKKVSNS